MLSNIATAISAAGLSVIQQPQTIPSLGPSASTNVSAQVYATSSAAGGPLSLSVNTHYISPYGYNTSLSSTLGLYTLATQAPAVSLGLSNETLTTGGVRREAVIVYDQSPYPLVNVTATVTPGGTLSLMDSDGFFQLPNVPAGGTSEAPMSFYLPATSSTVGSITVALSYVADGQSESVTRSLSLLTPGSVNLTQVSTTTLPATPVPGGIFTLTSTLDNAGSIAASAATATAHPPAGITVLGSSSTYIGSIPTGTPSAYTLSFTRFSIRSGRHLHHTGDPILPEQPQPEAQRHLYLHRERGRRDNRRDNRDHDHKHNPPWQFHQRQLSRRDLHLREPFWRRHSH